MGADLEAGTAGTRGLRRALYRRATVANAVGATLAYIYLTQVAPPQPPPPDDELIHYVLTGPAYFVLAVIAGRRLSSRRWRAVETRPPEDRPPTSAERAVALGLP